MPFGSAVPKSKHPLAFKPSCASVSGPYVPYELLSSYTVIAILIGAFGCNESGLVLIQRDLTLPAL